MFTDFHEENVAVNCKVLFPDVHIAECFTESTKRKKKFDRIDLTK